MSVTSRTVPMAAPPVALGCSPPEPVGAWLNADLEVYNGTLGFDQPDSQWLLAWEARVMDGRDVVLREVGGDVIVEVALDGDVVLEGELPEGGWYARVWTADGQILSVHGGMTVTNAIRVGP